MNKTAIFRAIQYSCLLLLLGLIASCAVFKAKSPAFTLLPYKFQSAFTEHAPRVCYIGSVNDWHACLKQLELKPDPTTPPVETLLDKQHLLLVYGGMRPTTGFSVEISAVHLSRKANEVKAKLLFPCNGSIQADMITYPMQLIGIKPLKRPGTWELQLEEIKTDCDE